MGTADFGNCFWKRYFCSEDDARKIDIFELIMASIGVASITKPDEFLSKKYQIVRSLLAATDYMCQAPEEGRTRCNNKTAVVPTRKNEQRTIVLKCEETCKGREFSNLERELEECAHVVKLGNFHGDKNRMTGGSEGCQGTQVIEPNNKKRKLFDARNGGVINESKFEASERRFNERIRQIEDAKRRVQILEVIPKQRMGRDGKPKKGFGTRMKKLQQLRC